MNHMKGSLSRVLWMLSTGMATREAGAGAAVRLADVGPSRLLQALRSTERIGQADLRELGADVAPAALEDAEDIAGREDVPGRQGMELGQDPARRLAAVHVRRLHDGPASRDRRGFGRRGSPFAGL